MGTLIYMGTGFEFDDRTLAHLKVAITAKLRRGESFLLGWSARPGEGAGRVSLWLSPEIPLVYRFADPDPVELNRRWLAALTHSAMSATGMTVIDEAEANDGPGGSRTSASPH